MLHTGPESLISSLFGFVLVNLSIVRHSGKVAYTTWLAWFGLVTASGASSIDLPSCPDKSSASSCSSHAASLCHQKIIVTYEILLGPLWDYQWD